MSGLPPEHPPEEAAGRDEMTALAKGGRTNFFGFVLRLVARIPFLFIAGRVYGPDTVGRFALAVLVVELAALLATLGLKRGLAQALSSTDRPHVHVVWDAMVVAFVTFRTAACALARTVAFSPDRAVLIAAIAVFSSGVMIGTSQSKSASARTGNVAGDS